MKDTHLDLLAECATEIYFKAGQRVLAEGENANSFYLLRDGKVRVEINAGEQEPVVLQLLGPGDVLGWSWLFPPYYWHFDAYALESTAAISIYSKRLRELCQADSTLGYSVMKAVSGIIVRRLQYARGEVVKGLRADCRQHATG